MQWMFKLRGKTVALNSVESAVAVRPSQELRSRAASRSEMIGMFGGPARDDAHGGSFGLDLPSRNREMFEQAGWLFVGAQPETARAAALRATVQDAQAVRPVFVDRSGSVVIGTNRVIVQTDPDLPTEEALRLIQEDGLSPVRQLRFARNTFEVRLPTHATLPELVGALQDSGRYVFAEPDLLQAITGRFIPTDPRFTAQWQHRNDGSNGGIAGADIQATTAWDLTRGQGIKIAVIDNGMQVDHPDLAPGIIGGGFFVADATGNAIFQRFVPGNSFPDNDHGTFCMGMAGARVNNQSGGCGSAPEASLLPVACLSDQIGTQTTLARAVAYAADPTREDGQASAADGADVIACSLGPNSAEWDITSALDLAIQFAATNGRNGLGTPIFWAASNGFFPVVLDEVCSHPDVIAVGRSNRFDLQDGSAFGPELEFLAPGVDVFSTESGGGFGFSTGTSFAAPLTAGVGALVLARYPHFTAQQVRQRLRDTCDKIGGVAYGADGHHDQYGFGRINAERAAQ